MQDLQLHTPFHDAKPEGTAIIGKECVIACSSGGRKRAHCCWNTKPQRSSAAAILPALRVAKAQRSTLCARGKEAVVCGEACAVRREDGCREYAHAVLGRGGAVAFPHIPYSGGCRGILRLGRKGRVVGGDVYRYWEEFGGGL